jgi:hypothetical protein
MLESDMATPVINSLVVVPDSWIAHVIVNFTNLANWGTSVQPVPSLDKLAVEYAASRLSEKDVEAVLHRFRLPIKRKWAVP